MMTHNSTFRQRIQSAFASPARPRRSGAGNSRRPAQPRGLRFEPLEERRLLAVMSLAPTADNTIYAADAGASNGAGEYLFAGPSGNSAVRRALLAFDVSGIPATAQIHEASLELAVSRTSASTTTEMALHRLTRDWGEGTSDAPSTESGGAPASGGGATWSHSFFNTSSWTAPGGDFAAAPTAAAIVGASGTTSTWSSANMVADIEAWRANPSSNFGWILIGEETRAGSVRRFDSRETVSGDSPTLSVKYFETDRFLTVSINSNSITENGGTTSVVITRSQTDGDLTVDLSSSDVGEAGIIGSITIPSGHATSDPIAITGINDPLRDGTQEVTITASAAGYESDSDTLDVTDDETTLVHLQDGNLIIEDVDGETTDDHFTIALDGSTLVLSDPNNSFTTELASATGDGTQELRVPLTAFAGQVRIETRGGADNIVLDASVDNSLADKLIYAGGPGEDSLILTGEGLELQLSQFTGVDHIDISGFGDNSLAVDLASAQANVDGASDSLTLLSNRGDSLTFDTDWSIPETRVVGDAFFRVVKNGDTTLQIQGPNDWQNPVQPLDVEGDNDIAPRDALLIINELNQPVYTGTGGLLNDAASLDPFPLSFFDVVGNGFAAPSDAIRVIDFLNEQARGSGEGERASRTSPAGGGQGERRLESTSKPSELGNGIWTRGAGDAHTTSRQADRRIGSLTSQATWPKTREGCRAALSADRDLPRRAAPLRSSRWSAGELDEVYAEANTWFEDVLAVGLDQNQ